MAIKLYVSQANQGHNAGPGGYTEKAGMDAISRALAGVFERDDRFAVKRNAAGQPDRHRVRERRRGERLGRRLLRRAALQRRRRRRPRHLRLLLLEELEGLRARQGDRRRGEPALAGQGRGAHRQARVHRAAHAALPCLPHRARGARLGRGREVPHRAARRHRRGHLPGHLQGARTDARCPPRPPEPQAVGRLPAAQARGGQGGRRRSASPTAGVDVAQQGQGRPRLEALLRAIADRKD